MQWSGGSTYHYIGHQIISSLIPRKNCETNISCLATVNSEGRAPLFHWNLQVSVLIYGISPFLDYEKIVNGISRCTLVWRNWTVPWYYKKCTLFLELWSRSSSLNDSLPRTVQFSHSSRHSFGKISFDGITILQFSAE